MQRTSVGIRDLDLDGHENPLKTYCANWLTDNAIRAGQVLKEHEAPLRLVH